MDKHNNTTNFLCEDSKASRKGNRRSLSLSVLRQARSSNNAPTPVEPRETEDSLRVYLPISGRHLGPGWGKRAVAPTSFEFGESQPLTPYQRHPIPERGTGNFDGVGNGENSIENPGTFPEGCSPKGIKRARSTSPRDESKHHTRIGQKLDPAPPTDLPRSDRMLQVSLYDILRTRTYAHYRAQLRSPRAVSETAGGNLEPTLPEHTDSPFLHKRGRPWSRDSSNVLAKPGYRTQNMLNDNADLWPATSGVAKEPSGPSLGHGNTPSPASVNRSLTPGSREGFPAARTATPRLRPTDSRITKRSQDGLKGRSKVLTLASQPLRPNRKGDMTTPNRRGGLQNGWTRLKGRPEYARLPRLLQTLSWKLGLRAGP